LSSDSIGSGIRLLAYREQIIALLFLLQFTRSVLLSVNAAMFVLAEENHDDLALCYLRVRVDEPGDRLDVSSGSLVRRTGKSEACGVGRFFCSVLADWNPACPGKSLHCEFSFVDGKSDVTSFEGFSD
jgi:hypothetical protein